MPVFEELERDEMMSHLMSALEKGQDIGHYGRLVFVLGARHFMSTDELLQWLTKDKDCDEEKARMLITQVQQRNYNPPRRETVIAWMERQRFPICPNPDDPDGCNLYKSFEFPHQVYEHIGNYREQKAEARS